MNTIEVESWALRVLASVQAGKPFEDARVELKAAFPTDPQKAARRIAAHANSAMSAPILWLIGVDQKSGVVGANPAELANWFSGVKACFDGVAPALRDLVIHFNNATVQALQFTTDRAPYLVKNMEGGAIQREVPWREGTAVRTATREELLRILQPDLPVPEIEVLAAEVRPVVADNNSLSITASMEIYVVPVDEARVVIPFHRCFGKIISQGRVIAERLKVDVLPEFQPSTWRPFDSSAPIVNVHGGLKSLEHEQHQLIVNRPALVTLHMVSGVVALEWGEISMPTLELTLGLANGRGRACVIGAHLASHVRSERSGNPIEWRL